MSADLHAILRSIGLDDKQSRLYLAGLQLGSAPASEYAGMTDMNRITTYNVLEELVEKGLFTLERAARGKRYAPVSPNALALEAQKNVEAFQKALPELRSLQKAKYRKPHVRFFEGWDGIRRVYEDSLAASTEILNYANSAVVRRLWPEYDRQYVERRVSKGIRLRGIAPDDAMGRRVHGDDTAQLREIRLVPEQDFDFTNEIHIYDDKVAICSFGTADGTSEDIFGILLESHEVAETQRQIFEMAWRYAKAVSVPPHPRPFSQPSERLIA